jgi:uncharacterized RDD family membrane protein YckC
MEESILQETPANRNNIIYPSLTERIKSSSADLIFILFLMSVIAMTFDQYTDVPDWLRAGLFIFLFLIYEPLAQTFGCTLGNYIMGIRVKQESNPTKRINIAQAYLRFAVKTALGIFSFFTINSNPERRAIHDIASGSVMIYAK